MKYAVIIPVFNEEHALRSLLIALKERLQSMPATEIIVVDDGSTDQSGTIASSVEGVRVIRHDINRGYGAAIKTGMLTSSTDLILIIDADGTYPIDRIPALLKDADSHDMVVGARTGDRVYHSLLRRMAKWPINRLANYLVNVSIPDLNSGLRVFRKDLACKYLRILPNGFSFTTNITLAFLSDGYRVKYIPINYEKRAGRSKVRPFHDAVNYFTLVVRIMLYYNPLKVFGPIAVLLFVCSVASLIYDVVILRNLTEKSLILFLGFIQISLIGFLADLINKRGSYT